MVQLFSVLSTTWEVPQKMLQDLIIKAIARENIAKEYHSR